MLTSLTLTQTRSAFCRLELMPATLGYQRQPQKMRWEIQTLGLSDFPRSTPTCKFAWTRCFFCHGMKTSTGELVNQWIHFYTNQYNSETGEHLLVLFSSGAMEHRSGKWEPWGPWSHCPVTAGLHQPHRHRESDQCSGSREGCGWVRYTLRVWTGGGANMTLG